MVSNDKFKKINVVNQAVGVEAEVKIVAPKALHTGSEIQTLLLADINVDPSYQRGLKAHRRHIIREWNPDAAGVLKVGRRSNGEYWLIDGQQRRDSMIKMGIDRWRCEVIPSSGPEYEAAVFHLMNGPRGRSSLGTQDLFKAALKANDPTAIATKEAIEDAGFTVDYRRHNDHENGLSCVGQLYKYVSTHGKALTVRGLRIVNDAWPSIRDARRDVVIMGILRLYAISHDVIDDQRMVKILSTKNVLKLYQEAGFLMGSRLTNFGRVVAKEYNKRLHLKNKIGQDVMEGGTEMSRHVAQDED